MRVNIPQILLFSRLGFACTIILLSFVSISYEKIIVLWLMYLGVFSDIFDGIFARKQNTSSQKFRITDTLIDLVFYLSIAFFIYSFNPTIITDNLNLIVGILGLEGLMYLISFVRFRQFPSPHDILSKFWAIYLLIEFTLLLIGFEGTHFTIALNIGLLVHSQRVLIYVILKHWEHDIPSVYHAFLLRKGIKIKRMKLFNG
ncbi:MAG: CDP-alcohol phosphatidyltransferase family protein [Bacteroidota bacterium]